MFDGLSQGKSKNENRLLHLLEHWSLLKGQNFESIGYAQ